MWHQNSCKTWAMYNVQLSKSPIAKPRYNATVCSAQLMAVYSGWRDIEILYNREFLFTDSWAPRVALYRRSTLLCPNHFINCIQQRQRSISICRQYRVQIYARTLVILRLFVIFLSPSRPRTHLPLLIYYTTRWYGASEGILRGSLSKA